MTCRNMDFEVVEEVFKEVLPEIVVDQGNDIAYIHYMEGCVGVASVECCGWLEVSSLKACTKTSQEKIYKILTVLMNENCIYSDPAADWNEDEEPVKFPLFCVTTDDSVAKWLKENGWESMTPFINPNSRNKCMPFYWHS